MQRSKQLKGDEDQARQLLRRIANGDKSAMRILFSIHSDAAFNFARSWLQNPYDAADVLNDAMIDVWRSADQFAGRSSVRSWIFAIVRNKAIDRNRKGARLTYSDCLPDMVDQAPSPDACLTALQDAEIVRACMSKLSDTHRRVIHLAFFEDLSYREIAEIEDCPIGTVKTRIMHAKSLLQKYLADDAHKPRPKIARTALI